MIPSNPRLTAFEILLRIEKERSYADVLLDRALSGDSLKGPDRGLLTELVYGVLRRKGTLDHIIAQVSNRQPAKLERAVLVLLRLGIYQELFLDRIPVSAAVNETVKLAHTLAPKATGFINALLRRVDRERNVIPYPDKGLDPVGFISSRHSAPAWMVEEWIHEVGVIEAESLAQAMLATPPFTVRVNSLKTNRETLIARLSEEGICSKDACYSPFAVHLSGPVQLRALTSFREGLFTVQDESSQLAAIFLSPRAGEKVLDICAAPGGKTTHLAQLMENRGAIIACDAAPRKLTLIEEASGRLGIDIIRTLSVNATRPEQLLKDMVFDKILVDAPCSGLGVLRRNPEGKWWKTKQNITELALVQQAILSKSSDYLVAGGTLLYATCSTTYEENEAVVDDFLSQHSNFVLEDLRMAFPEYDSLFTDRGCFRSWPHRHGMDGFFAARLKKSTS